MPESTNEEMRQMVDQFLAGLAEYAGIPWDIPEESKPECESQQL